MWAEKLYGAVTFVRAFLSRIKGPKESAPTELQMPTAAPLPIPGPALTTLVVDVEPEPEPVSTDRPLRARQGHSVSGLRSDSGFSNFACEGCSIGP